MAKRPVATLVPGSVADVRGRAFGEAMEQALSEPDFTRLLFERFDTVDASVLPFLVREAVAQDFLALDMRTDVVRGVIKAAPVLNAQRGTLAGVRAGLALLGMRMVWKQWFQRTPRGAPGTHVATIYPSAVIFKGQRARLDERVQAAALGMVDGMKRWSQDVDVRFGIGVVRPTGLASGARGLVPVTSALRPKACSAATRGLGLAGGGRALGAVHRAMSTRLATSLAQRLGAAAGARAAVFIHRSAIA